MQLQKHNSFLFALEMFFFKHYSPDATNPLIWDREAGKDYVRAMMNVIGNFIGVTSFNNFDNLNSKEIEFGLIRK